MYLVVRRSPQGGDTGNEQLDVAKLLVQRCKAPAGQAIEQGQEELQIGALLLHSTHTCLNDRNVQRWAASETGPERTSERRSLLAVSSHTYTSTPGTTACAKTAQHPHLYTHQCMHECCAALMLTKEPASMSITSIFTMQGSHHCP